MPEVAGFVGEFDGHLAFATGLFKYFHHAAFAFLLRERIHQEDSLPDSNSGGKRQKPAVETYRFGGGDTPKRMVAGCPAV